MTWRTGQERGQGIGWTPEQLRAQRTRSTNYERGIIATVTVDAIEGGNRAKKVQLRLTHYNSAAGHKVWFNGMMVKSLHITPERVTLVHFDTHRDQEVRRLSATITRKAWDKFTAKAEATEQGSVRKAMSNRVDVAVEGVAKGDLPPAPPVPADLAASHPGYRVEFPVW